MTVGGRRKPQRTLGSGKEGDKQMGKAIKIAADEVVVSRRGRTASFDADLLEDLSDLQAGEALDLSPYFGTVEDKTERQKVAAEIRKHWRNVRKDDLRIDFGGNVPQVRIKG